jgi:glycine oxidase
LSISSPSSGSLSVDVAIIGGGIIGLLTARELSLAGAAVAVIDRGSIGREASWAGGGILSPLYPWRYSEAITRLASWSQQYYPQLVDDLLQSTGIDPEYRRSGLLISPEKDSDLANIWSEKHGNAIEIVGIEEVRELQPGLFMENESWLWMSAVAQVRNPRLISSIRSYLSGKSIKFLENVHISEFLITNGRFQGIDTLSGRINAEQCLVASGAWSGGLMQKVADLAVPIEPVRGQMLLLKGRRGLLQRMVLKNRHYLIPRAEHVGFEKQVTDAAQKELLSAAQEIYPDLLLHTEIETQWAGLRPGSPEGIPFIGPHPEVEGLFLCSGHYRNGFVLGPASARLVTDLMLQRQPIMDASPYRLGR